ncbi:Serine/threonine-protein phosphatase PP1 [Xylaria arbuscula]|nr:Serine/threonine-protein phosphatase PP1 [Xylaria arbuscula]
MINSELDDNNNSNRVIGVDSCEGGEKKAPSQSLQPALSIWEIKSLCEKAKEILLSQSALLELEAPMVVCGDVQGQFTNLLQCFDIGGFPPAANYLFMGNYVGETPDIKTICLLFSYKIKYPENFFLLRGSQELQEIPRRSPDYDNIEKWNAITDVFNCLPFAAIIDDKIFVVHGGLSPDLTSMEQIRGIVRPIHSLSDDHLLSHLLSTNPNNKITGWSKDTLGSWQFRPDVVSRFLQKHNLDLICRSHERVIGGYEFFAERQLVTVYSASNEDYVYLNEAAVLSVSEELSISFQITDPDSAKPKWFRSPLSNGCSTDPLGYS